MNRKPKSTPPVNEPVSESSSYRVVGIGASAGELDVAEGQVGSLPDRPGMAFVVVMHLSPEHPSHLDSMPASATPQDSMRI